MLWWSGSACVEQTQYGGWCSIIVSDSTLGKIKVNKNCKSTCNMFLSQSRLCFDLCTAASVFCRDCKLMFNECICCRENTRSHNNIKVFGPYSSLKLKDTTCNHTQQVNIVYGTCNNTNLTVHDKYESFVFRSHRCPRQLIDSW